MIIKKNYYYIIIINNLNKDSNFKVCNMMKCDEENSFKYIEIVLNFFIDIPVQLNYYVVQVIVNQFAVVED
jgi:hypothetical protein